jgi:DNA-binding NarL/FixJ family response regulator
MLFSNMSTVEYIMINAVLINSQKQDQEKIESILSTDENIRVLASGKDGYDALKLIGSLKPDVAILDNHLDFIKGEEIPPLIKLRSPSTAVVILIARISDSQLLRAASNEVSGLALKEADINTLPWILKCVNSGGCFISPALAARVLHLLSSISPENGPTRTAGKSPIKASGNEELKFSVKEDPAAYLSKMELRILSHIGEGLTSAEIALKLDLTVGTVRNYVSSVMHKTGLRNRSQMARCAYFYGLAPLNP